MPSIKVLAEGRRRTKPFHLGVYVNLKKEVDKCIVLCANCHREFHHYEKTNGITLEQFLK